MKHFLIRIEDYINSIDNDNKLHYENRLITALFIPVYILWAIFIVVTFSILGIARNVITLDASIVIFNAAFLLAVQKIRMADTLRSNLIMVSFSIFYVFVIYHFRRVTGDSIWVISGTFLLISLLKFNYNLLIIICIETIAMAIVIRLIYPNTLSQVAFASQLALLIGIFFFATLIKFISIHLYSKVIQHSKRSKAIAKISSELLDANAENLDDMLEKAVEEYRKAFNVEKISIIFLSHNNTYINMHIECCDYDIRTSDEIRAHYEISNDFWWDTQIKNKSVFMLNDIQKQDDSVSLGISIMKKQGVNSFLSVPIVKDENVYGFVFVQSFKSNYTFVEPQLQTMKVFANLIGGAYKKVKSEEEVTKLAYWDTLTGLPNRYQFNVLLEKRLDHVLVHNTTLAVLFLDLDSFKSINDTMGHEGGDALLKEVAVSLKTQMKSEDIVARFGGDEFIVLLTDFKNEDELIERACDIMKVFENPIIINNKEFYIAASAGISVYPEDGKNRNSLIKNADLAMYQAKDKEINQIVRCTVRPANKSQELKL